MQCFLHPRGTRGRRIGSLRGNAAKTNTSRSNARESEERERERELCLALLLLQLQWHSPVCNPQAWWQASQLSLPGEHSSLPFPLLFSHANSAAAAAHDDHHFPYVCVFIVLTRLALSGIPVLLHQISPFNFFLSNFVFFSLSLSLSLNLGF